MKTKAPSGEILTVSEVAAYLNVHTSTVYRLLTRGRIPAFKVGSDWRFSRTRLKEWIDDQYDQPFSAKKRRKGKPAAN